MHCSLKNRVGFQHGKSIVDQVVLLTQNIEDSFKVKKASAIFVDLTAIVWHHGLICKLLRLLPDKHMVRMIMELVQNQSSTLTTRQQAKQATPSENRHSSRSILTPLLFNIYTYDLPSMISRKFASRKLLMI